MPEDADEGYPGRVLLQDLIEKSKGEFKAEDVIAKELGSIHPFFLEDQLNRSLKNLGLESIDVYYLHNSYETYGVWVTMDEYMKKLAKAFEFLERK